VTNRYGVNAKIRAGELVEAGGQGGPANAIGGALHRPDAPRASVAGVLTERKSELSTSTTFVVRWGNVATCSASTASYLSTILTVCSSYARVRSSRQAACVNPGH
jgi:hypothetical protein